MESHFNHEFEESSFEDNPYSTTYNPNTKHYISQWNSPKKVDEGKYIIFTYDVLFMIFNNAFVHQFCGVYYEFNLSMVVAVFPCLSNCHWKLTRKPYQMGFSDGYISSHEKW